MRHPVPITRDQEIHGTSIPNECVLRPRVTVTASAGKSSPVVRVPLPRDPQAKSIIPVGKGEY
jgi:hypothetical protein